MRRSFLRPWGGVVVIIMTFFGLINPVMAADETATTRNESAISWEVSVINGTQAGLDNLIASRENPGFFDYLGQRLAKAGRAVALRRHSVGHCLAGVQDALEAIGIRLPRKVAAADLAPVLSQDERFQELYVPREELTSLPPGHIVVWGKSSDHPYGHIIITLGDGQESSDHIQRIQPNITPTYRVFAPSQPSILSYLPMFQISG